MNEWPLVLIADRLDALEREVADVHRENTELRDLLVAHKMAPQRPRLRLLPHGERA